MIENRGGAKRKKERAGMSRAERKRGGRREEARARRQPTGPNLLYPARTTRGREPRHTRLVIPHTDTPGAKQTCHLDSLSLTCPTRETRRRHRAADRGHARFPCISGSSTPIFKFRGYLPQQCIIPGISLNRVLFLEKKQKTKLF
jgi:hypothetical protein